MTILDIIIITLIVAWLRGFALGFVGDLIHLILLVAGVIFIVRLLT